MSFSMKRFKVKTMKQFLVLIIIFFQFSSAHAVCKHTLTETEKYDLLMLEWGGFAPLHSFHNQQDYHSILEHMRLADGTLWPIPILLTLNEDEKRGAEIEKTLVLQDEDENILAIMEAEEFFRPDVNKEALSIF